MSNAECRVWYEKRLEQCYNVNQSLQRLYDIALLKEDVPKNEKNTCRHERKASEKKRSPPVSSLYLLLVKQERSALCHVHTEQYRTVHSTSQMRKASSDCGNYCAVLVFCVQGRSCPRLHKQYCQPKKSNLSAPSFKRSDRDP